MIVARVAHGTYAGGRCEQCRETSCSDTSELLPSDVFTVRAVTVVARRGCGRRSRRSSGSSSSTTQLADAAAAGADCRLLEPSRRAPGVKATGGGAAGDDGAVDWDGGGVPTAVCFRSRGLDMVCG